MNSKTTVPVASGAAALGALIVLAAKLLGVEVDSNTAIVVAGAFITLFTAAVTYFHNPKP